MRKIEAVKTETNEKLVSGFDDLMAKHKPEELVKFEELIAEAQKSIGAKGNPGHVKSIKTADPEDLAFKTLVVLDGLLKYGGDDNEELIEIDGQVTYAHLSVSIGRALIGKLENVDEDIKKINARRFKVGAWMVDRLKDFRLIGSKLVDIKPKKRVLARLRAKYGDDLILNQQRVITISKRASEKLNNVLAVLPVNKEGAEMDERPLFERPEPFKSFYHPLGAELVRSRMKELRNEFTAEKMPQVFDAINKQIQTGYKINVELLELYDKMPITSVSNFKRKRRSRKQLESEVVKTDKTLEEAKKIGEREFWLMNYYDFRGRMYQSTTDINYGANKLNKSLFLLADAKPLGKHGLKWLKVHIANSWKWDKLPIDERVKKVDENLRKGDKLIDLLNINKEFKRLSKADDPYLLLAGLLELKRVLASPNPEAELSGLPIAFDMTCSGLQILSMLSKDRDGGNLCNLLPNAKRSDYYQFIADNLEAFKSHPFWYAYRGISRGIVKRSAMTYFYSCGAETMGDHIWQDHYAEPEFKGKITRQYCNELGKEIYEVCDKLLDVPTAMMKAFIEVGNKLAEEGKQLQLTMPTGFIFKQSYMTDVRRSVSAIYQGDRIHARITLKKGDKINKMKVATATSPNVVHAFDAVFLSYVVTNAKFDTAIIHDSFASVAGDAEDLYRIIRETAVELFSGDILEETIGDIGIKKGSLRIAEIAKNEYFAS